MAPASSRCHAHGLTSCSGGVWPQQHESPRRANLSRVLTELAASGTRPPPDRSGQALKFAHLPRTLSQTNAVRGARTPRPWQRRWRNMAMSWTPGGVQYWGHAVQFPMSLPILSTVHSLSGRMSCHWKSNPTVPTHLLSQGYCGAPCFGQTSIRATLGRRSPSLAPNQDSPNAELAWLPGLSSQCSGPTWRNPSQAGRD